MNTKMETDVKKTFNFICGSGGVLQFTDLVSTPSPLARLTASDAKRKLEETAKTYSCFTLRRHGDKISSVSIYFRTRLCVKYLQKGECSRGSKCNNWHICKRYMEGNCRKEDCQFSHNFKDDQNLKTLEALEMSQFPNITIRKILSRCLPRVCKDYVKGCCVMGENCANLHICSKLVENSCPVNEVNCLFSHNLKSPPNVSALRKAELTPRLPHSILFPHILLPALEQLPLTHCEFNSTKLGARPLPNHLAVNENVKKQQAENARTINSPYQHVWSEAKWSSKFDSSDQNGTLQTKKDLRNTTRRYLHEHANQRERQDQKGPPVSLSFITPRKSLHTGSKVTGKRNCRDPNQLRLCSEFILGKCQKASACDEHHFHLPYLWQCVDVTVNNNEWRCFTEEENEAIEKSYCDVYTGTCTKRVDLNPIITWFSTEDKVVKLDFQNMTLKHKNLDDPISIRRLSTRSFSYDGGVMSTKWVWYWNDTPSCGHILWYAFGYGPNGCGPKDAVCMGNHI